MILKIIRESNYSRNLKIQKLIYIYQEELQKNLFKVDFTSFKYGPYSSDIYKVIDIMISNEFIVDRMDRYIVTDKGTELFSKINTKIIDNKNIDYEYFEEIIKCFVDATSDKVLKYVYNNYDKHLDRSIIADKLIYTRGDYDWIKNTRESIEKIKSRALQKMGS